METVFDINQIGLIIPVIFVSVFAVLVFVFGFKKTNPLPDINKDLLTETNKRKKDKVSYEIYAQFKKISTWFIKSYN